MGKPSGSKVPLGWDPFTGKAVEFKKYPTMGDCWFAIGPKYLFGPFATMADLLVAFSTRDGVTPEFETVGGFCPVPVAYSEPKLPAKATEPLLNCPFTGQKLYIGMADPNDPDSSWYVGGPKYRIVGFLTEKLATCYISQRNGVEPDFAPAKIQSYKECEEPEEDPTSDIQNLRELKEASHMVNNAADDRKKRMRKGS